MNSNQTNNDTNKRLSREDLETNRLSKDETINAEVMHEIENLEARYK